MSENQSPFPPAQGGRSPPKKKESTEPPQLHWVGYRSLKMCGIVAYIGHRQAQPVLVEGLKRLEYRGYDSAGVAIENGPIAVSKSVGRVGVLEELLSEGGGFAGSVGIAHTRWATHGEPSDLNAHPHSQGPGDGHGVVLVHNGIIENHLALKTWLIDQGHEFIS